MMPTYILLCRDKADHGALRAETREAHLGYIKGAANAVLLAGPLLDDDEKPVGSMLIIEASNLDDAKQFAAGDPYARAGLFQTVDVRPYRIVTGELAKEKA
ncbi:MAG: hypothetical protein DHS20C05_11600 [Hyphococcus sp.]|nr:MAG: hypothetical protein DHS20C05_11600 [Marinicaulis sp.]